MFKMETSQICLNYECFTQQVIQNIHTSIDHLKNVFLSSAGDATAEIEDEDCYYTLLLESTIKDIVYSSNDFVSIIPQISKLEADIISLIGLISRFLENDMENEVWLLHFCNDFLDIDNTPCDEPLQSALIKDIYEFLTSQLTWLKIYAMLSDCYSTSDPTVALCHLVRLYSLMNNLQTCMIFATDRSLAKDISNPQLFKHIFSSLFSPKCVTSPNLEQLRNLFFELIWNASIHNNYIPSSVLFDKDDIKFTLGIDLGAAFRLACCVMNVTAVQSMVKVFSDDSFKIPEKKTVLKSIFPWQKWLTLALIIYNVGVDNKRIEKINKLKTDLVGWTYKCISSGCETENLLLQMERFGIGCWLMSQSQITGDLFRCFFDTNWEAKKIVPDASLDDVDVCIWRELLSYSIEHLKIFKNSQPMPSQLLQRSVTSNIPLYVLWLISWRCPIEEEAFFRNAISYMQEGDSQSKNFIKLSFEGWILSATMNRLHMSEWTDDFSYRWRQTMDSRSFDVLLVDASKSQDSIVILILVLVINLSLIISNIVSNGSSSVTEDLKQSWNSIINKIATINVNKNNILQVVQVNAFQRNMSQLVADLIITCGRDLIGGFEFVSTDENMAKWRSVSILLEGLTTDLCAVSTLFGQSYLRDLTCLTSQLTFLNVKLMQERKLENSHQHKNHLSMENSLIAAIFEESGVSSYLAWLHNQSRYISNDSKVCSTPLPIDNKGLPPGSTIAAAILAHIHRAVLNFENTSSPPSVVIPDWLTNWFFGNKLIENSDCFISGHRKYPPIVKNVKGHVGLLTYPFPICTHSQDIKNKSATTLQAIDMHNDKHLKLFIIVLDALNLTCQKLHNSTTIPTENVCLHPCINYSMLPLIARCLTSAMLDPSLWLGKAINQSKLTSKLLEFLWWGAHIADSIVKPLGVTNDMKESDVDKNTQPSKKLDLFSRFRQDMESFYRCSLLAPTDSFPLLFQISNLLLIFFELADWLPRHRREPASQSTVGRNFYSFGLVIKSLKETRNSILASFNVFQSNDTIEGQTIDILQRAPEWRKTIMTFYFISLRCIPPNRINNEYKSQQVSGDIISNSLSFWEQLQDNFLELQKQLLDGAALRNGLYVPMCTLLIGIGGLTVRQFIQSVNNRCLLFSNNENILSSLKLARAVNWYENKIKESLSSHLEFPSSAIILTLLMNTSSITNRLMERLFKDSDRWPLQCNTPQSQQVLQSAYHWMNLMAESVFKLLNVSFDFESCVPTFEHIDSPITKLQRWIMTSDIMRLICDFVIFITSQTVACFCGCVVRSRGDDCGWPPNNEISENGKKLWLKIMDQLISVQDMIKECLWVSSLFHLPDVSFTMRFIHLLGAPPGDAAKWHTIVDIRRWRCSSEILLKKENKTIEWLSKDECDETPSWSERVFIVSCDYLEWMKRSNFLDANKSLKSAEIMLVGEAAKGVSSDQIGSRLILLCKHFRIYLSMCN
eukprot:GHVL01009122.1.p1 GENE.GHVL01009122.1~~GHVL01009122.1.p1  ORF type:complete len:1465 (+),score=202.24 GHVL01009122.1:4300-8694(+)